MSLFADNIFTLFKIEHGCVLSISLLCGKDGKLLVSRQFVEMTRMRTEGLLTAFPKLLGSNDKQHTYIETDSVRYVYQQIENIFLVIITNHASNIIEDLETLKVVSKVLLDIIGTSKNINEEKINDNAFDLLCAFDEVQYCSLHSYVRHREYHSLQNCYVCTPSAPDLLWAMLDMTAGNTDSHGHCLLIPKRGMSFLSNAASLLCNTSG